MQTISAFFGIRIRMCADGRNQPHFHATYRGSDASYDFEGNRLEGSMPHRQEAFIRAWALLRSEDLQVAWDMAHDGERPLSIEPLR